MNYDPEAPEPLAPEPIAVHVPDYEQGDKHTIECKPDPVLISTQRLLDLANQANRQLRTSLRIATVLLCLIAVLQLSVALWLLLGR